MSVEIDEKLLERASAKRDRLKLRSRSKSIPFDLNKLDVYKMCMATKCPCCKNKMSLISNDEFEVTVDRIIPDLGYTKKNTVAICRKCNGLKADMSESGLNKAGLNYISIWLNKEITKRALKKRYSLMSYIRVKIAKKLIKIGRGMLGL